ncbi:Cell division inhibitor [Gracilibacillus halophilus YIM-C55.5]|uniref:Cell division inhibitor n=1 Tax=Gracilibacillus halophilus YIM-C55.5 TaxID=1308866 RepID=N4WHV8_9BACI|nr:TIGR01777 family oxidoreductase [Gracilibacillus halophilus]ENH95762.1 Cell division inhibitor [Gracilibacillus halophilus YIM-C55.5]
MNIVIAGGTGFVGNQLTEALINRGDHVYILTRNPQVYHDRFQVTYVGWDPARGEIEDTLPAIDCVINLAGDSLFGYWTKKKKQRIYQSRIDATKTLINWMKHTEVHTFINASAVGYFGTSETETFTEETDTQGDDFLAKVTSAWEGTALEAETLGIRTVLTRFGVILSKDDGALPLMALPFRLFVGGKIGNGKQWVPWVHIDDVVQLLMFAIDHYSLQGALHVTAPEPVRNERLAKALSTVLHRPKWFTTPAKLMQLGLGDMSILITDGQYVLPKKAKSFGYQFQYTSIEQALHAIYT